MLVEREPIVVVEYHHAPYDTGALVHRAFSEGDREMRLTPCAAWWLPRRLYRVVATHPTCVYCIATRRP